MKQLIALLVLAWVTTSALVASEGLEIPQEPAPLTGPIIEIFGNGYPIYNTKSHAEDYDLTDFESVAVGDREDHSFSIHNAGDSDLVLDGPLLVGLVGSDHKHFQALYFPRKTLAPGEWSAFTIRFEPESGGEKIITVSINSNSSSNSRFAFNVEGDGYDLNWFVVGGCGTSQTMGVTDAIWIPLVMLIVLALRRRAISCG